MLTRINAWLNAHPYAKGALTVAEAAAFGALMDAFTNPASFTRAGWHQTLLTIGGAVALAVRNYIKQSPRKEWTDAQRAAAAISNPPGPQDPLVTAQDSTSPDKSAAATGGRP